MSYTGNEDHDISLQTASAWTKNYRDSVSPGAIIAHHIGKTAIQDILDQTNCTGLRVYYAIKDTGEKQLVFVGVDSLGNDLYMGKLADRTWTCPSDCSSANPLNSNPLT